MHPQLRLVIIDDDASIRKVLRQIVEAIDAEVVGEADAGLAGTELVDRVEPDLLLLDVSMPGMDGFEVTRYLRERMPRLPIIFVSQHSNLAYADEASRCGAQGYVVKRAAVTELPDAIRAVLAGRSFRSLLLVSP